jgi:hypothetical protein
LLLFFWNSFGESGTKTRKRFTINAKHNT